jgi:hypothetical protein
MNLSYPLLSNASATGGSASIGRPGRYVVSVAGTFGGATVALQMLGPDGSTWLGLGTDATFTAAGVAALQLPTGVYRMAVTGGAPSGLYANLSRVGD